MCVTSRYTNQFSWWFFKKKVFDEKVGQQVSPSFMILELSARSSLVRVLPECLAGHHLEQWSLHSAICSVPRRF